MNIHHPPVRSGAMVIAAALALATSACSLPNKPATSAAATMSKPFSSGEILQVLHTLNNGEIKQAGLVFQRPTLPPVQKTAQMIIKDHTASNQRITAIAKASGIKLEESPLSRGLQAQANSLTESLAKLSGDEFECTYLQKQVELHAIALDTVRSQLLPAAQDPQIRELLTTTAPGLEAHRQAAQQTHASMSECARS
jgi:putative membrane protein